LLCHNKGKGKKTLCFSAKESLKVRYLGLPCVGSLYIHCKPGPVDAVQVGSLPSRQILLVSWLAEPIIKQHDGAIVCPVPDAPAYCLVQRPTGTRK